MKYLISCFLLCGVSWYASAQYSLVFCESVNDSGMAQKPANSFTVSKDGSPIKSLLKADDKMSTTQLEYRIFYINDKGKEEQLVSLPQTVEPNWNYAWNEMVFFDPGNYKVKVYNSRGYYVTSANLNIKQ